MSDLIKVPGVSLIVDSQTSSVAIGDTSGDKADVGLNDDALTFALKVKDDDANSFLSQIETWLESIDEELNDSTTELQDINTELDTQTAHLAQIETDITSLESKVLTDTQLRATPVPVSGALTDTELRATAVPVSGPLTDTELRATAVPVSMSDVATETTLALIKAAIDEIEIQANTNRNKFLVGHSSPNFINTGSTNIPASASAPLQIVASLAQDVNEVLIVEDIGEFIGLYEGAVSSETLLTVLPLGGGKVNISIAAGTRLSIRNMKNAVISSGFISFTFVGAQ